MSSPSSPARGRPPRLDRARTLETALALLDRSGLDALTMRSLAEAMDVRAGALYRYFATKQDLLTAMAERMMDGVADAAGAPGGDWSERLAALARGMRTALLAHRDGARVFAGTHATGENVLGFADTFVGALREAGFRDDDAVRALYTVANFTVGHTLEEQAALHPEDGGSADANALAETVANGPYPHLGADLPTLTSTDFPGLFEFGLRLLIDGLDARRRPAPGTTE
ncbi:TetR/AcrR family transcriptional regulator [Nocardiopsis sp. RSe5-2]|uniref:TetR/AcrR family transcriptional regulator n=1 Tax=Nocardiopsis endophytica TaxID=3018445 RepID=A0ABT4UCH7_9ACTN|nr:TetR/AcrR family transcriptional regulator [Nocardiopsis endophytica]MDA2814689.1 TetR/AcrR family transcriptional regulator [Nocardiopsis endophytica]